MTSVTPGTIVSINNESHKTYLYIQLCEVRLSCLMINLELFIIPTVRLHTSPGDEGGDTFLPY